MPINDNPNEQWQKLKGQGFKAHLAYFWEYYKFYVIGGILAIVFITALAKDIGSNLPYGLYTIMLNSTNTSTDTQNALEAEFAEYEGIDTNELDVFIDTTTSISVDSYDEYTMSNMEKIMALTAAKDIDVMTADPEMFAYYAKSEMFYDITELFTEEELESIGAQYYYIDQDYIDYISSEEYQNNLTSDTEVADYTEFSSTNPEDLGNPVAFGIVVTDAPVITDNNLYTGTEVIAGIICNTQRVDTAKDYIMYLFGK